MDSCDVLIVGGGPAGSACARALTRAGADVVVIDQATFPRHKVCAGWITPQVVCDLDLDLEDYRHFGALQPFLGFRVGIAGAESAVAVTYDAPVSFGIRRCEFDHYLLRRSGARLRLGTRVARIHRAGGRWILDDSIASPMLVGAGGQFCPVAAMINQTGSVERLVVAQAMECRIDLSGLSGDATFGATGEVPELYFLGDLSGYGWCVRKGDYINIGLGQIGGGHLPKACAQFVRFLKRTRRIPASLEWRPHGHAYGVDSSAARRIVADGVLLIGDAAALADARSGEGIGPAIRSGQAAAATILDTNGDYSRERLLRYQDAVRGGTTPARLADSETSAIRRAVRAALGRRALRSAWFVRHVVLGRWFLHPDRVVH